MVQSTVPQDAMFSTYTAVGRGECYDSSDNECGARRGGGPHAAWGRGDVLREFYCAYVAYTHYNEHFNSYGYL